MDYQDYLHSPAWKKQRDRILFRDDFTCQNCGSKEKLVVHHLSYKDFPDCPDSNLITLCNDCHKLFHVTDMELKKIKEKRKDLGRQLYDTVQKLIWKFYAPLWIDSLAEAQKVNDLLGHKLNIINLAMQSNESMHAFFRDYEGHNLELPWIKQRLGNLPSIRKSAKERIESVEFDGRKEAFEQAHVICECHWHYNWLPDEPHCKHLCMYTEVPLTYDSQGNFLHMHGSPSPFYGCKINAKSDRKLDFCPYYKDSYEEIPEEYFETRRINNSYKNPIEPLEESVDNVAKAKELK